MKSAVIVFPGSNCDRDAITALRDVSGSDPILVWHKDAALPKVDLVVVPGGFSYGDYLRCGAMAAHSPIMQDVVAQAKKGLHVLGICNGFQILAETGLLPGVLMCNSTLSFICKDVSLRVETKSVFTSVYKPKQILNVPIAHHDGFYYVDDDGLKSIEDNDQVAFRYVNAAGEPDATANPNGARNNIAGVYNKSKNVLALMPHPERAIDPLLGSTSGRGMFESLAQL